MNLYSRKRGRWSNFLSMEWSCLWKGSRNNMTLVIYGGMQRYKTAGQSQNRPTGIEFNSDCGNLFCWRETHRVNSESQQLQRLFEHCDDQTHTKIVRNSNPKSMMSHRYLISHRLQANSRRSHTHDACIGTMLCILTLNIALFRSRRPWVEQQYAKQIYQLFMAFSLCCSVSIAMGLSFHWIQNCTSWCPL
jgi:hypothetical protein